MKKTYKLALLSLLIAGATLTGCSKDPLNGSWKSEHMNLKFNTSSNTVSLFIPGQEGVADVNAKGTYLINTQEKLLVKITKHIDSKMDYTEKSKANGEYQLASLYLEGSNLTLSDFYGTSLTLTGGSGSSIQNISGIWSYKEEGASLELELNSADGSFTLREYTDDPFITDENGVVLLLQGNYRTESFTAITMNLTNDSGFPLYTSGELYFSDDKKTVYIDGQTFHR